MSSPSAFAILPLMYLTRYIDTKDEQVRQLAIAGYAVSFAIQFAVTRYIDRQIQKVADDTSQRATVVLEAGADKGKAVTPKEHDQRELSAVRNNAFVQAAIMFAMYKFGYIQPLLLQAIMGLVTLLTHSLTYVYVYGSPAEGKLARPWTKASALEAFLNAYLEKPAAPQADAADEPGVEEVTSE